MSRPDILPNPAPHYDTEFSKHPEQVRLSFSDGSTAVYNIDNRFPHPLVLQNAEIMKNTKQNIKQGYVNHPYRRRRRP